jgi:hypothetical protein
MISALSTVLGLADEKGEDYDVDAVVAQLKDPVGTFYKYALPASIIGRRIKK